MNGTMVNNQKLKSDFGELADDWNGIESIVLYGAGIVSTICENLFRMVDIDIPFVIDQDTKKQGKQWQGIPIISFEEAKPKITRRKIVVMTAHTAYNNISAFLNKEGLVEFQDYCRIGQFICEWFWNAKGMNGVYHIDTAITTRCTLNCKNCNMFIRIIKDIGTIHLKN